MIRVSIYGPNGLGAPAVTVTASGSYAPDVAHDLKSRAVETYTELFGDMLDRVLEVHPDGAHLDDIAPAGLTGDSDTDVEPEADQ